MHACIYKCVSQYHLVRYVCLFIVVLFLILRTMSPPVLFSIQLPLSARTERVQFSWTQESGFQANEDIWQLDNVALLYSSEIDTPQLSTFSSVQQSDFVMFYSGGNVEVMEMAIVA